MAQPEGMMTVRAGWGAGSWWLSVREMGWLCSSFPGAGLPRALWAPAITVACAGCPPLMA